MLYFRWRAWVTLSFMHMYLLFCRVIILISLQYKHRFDPLTLSSKYILDREYSRHMIMLADMSDHYPVFPFLLNICRHRMLIFQLTHRATSLKIKTILYQSQTVTRQMPNHRITQKRPFYCSTMNWENGMAEVSPCHRYLKSITFESLILSIQWWYWYLVWY